MEQQFWKCPDCDESNPFPSAKVCDTCGASIPASELARLNGENSRRQKKKPEQKPVRVLGEAKLAETSPPVIPHNGETIPSVAEKERLECERLERERLECERLECERLERERLECERLERERLEHERALIRAHRRLVLRRVRKVRSVVTGFAVLMFILSIVTTAGSVIWIHAENRVEPVRAELTLLLEQTTTVLDNIASNAIPHFLPDKLTDLREGAADAAAALPERARTNFTEFRFPAISEVFEGFFSRIAEY